MKHFRIFRSYLEMDISPGGVIYGLHTNRHREKTLCDALSTEGKLLHSFGDLSEIPRRLSPAMAFKLHVAPEGHVYIAHLPLGMIRKYSKEGKLIAEIQLKHEGMDKIIARNSSDQPKGHGQRICFSDFVMDGERILAARKFPRFEVIEFDLNGVVQKEFWFDTAKRYLFFNFQFSPDKHGHVRFYVPRVLPDRKIDVFASGGPAGS